MYRVDNWINEGSGWTIDSINGQYVNIYEHAPLFGSSFIELPSELKNPKKGLIHIKNKDNKCFLRCHVRHLNLVNTHSDRINKKDKEIANTIEYSSIDFPISKKDHCKIEKQNNIYVNIFSYGNGIIYPIYVSNEKFNNSMDLLLIHKENKPHYVYIKDSIDLCLIKVKTRIKSTSVDIVYNVLKVKIF